MAGSISGAADSCADHLQWHAPDGCNRYVRILMRSRWNSLTRGTAIVMMAVLSASVVTGCYVYEPVTSSMVAPGKTIALDLNDLGRLNLAALIGPEVKRVSGVLVSQASGEYVVRVTELDFFNGKESQWSGEAITVRKDYVNTVYEEK